MILEPPLEPEHCVVCGREPDHQIEELACDCPECSECGVIGDPDCYRLHGLPYTHDSVDSLCDWIGIAPISSALRAVERHNAESMWLILRGGGRLRYDNHQKELEQLAPYTRLAGVGVGGIAWDCSDWEHSEEVPAGNGWEEVRAARGRFHEALEEHNAMMEAEEEEASEEYSEQPYCRWIQPNGLPYTRQTMKTQAIKWLKELRDKHKPITGVEPGGWRGYDDFTDAMIQALFKEEA